MKMVKCLSQHELLEKGIDALYKELGPVEARRFMAFSRPARREDSVKRHRRWQASLDKELFMTRIEAAHEQARKR
ncbi:MAG: hypothetical protein JXA18_14745 [Chitinispirillaceae bacterium]|nr:hypothetical protein [Chitinispirillaceae bacterium]